MADLSLDNIGKQPLKAKRPGVAETTTALGQTVGGATPDQAKMAGTPAQVTSAAQHNAAAPAAPALPKLSSEKRTTGTAFADALRLANPAAIDATLEEEKQKSRLERESILGKARMDARDIIQQATEGQQLEVKEAATEDDLVGALKAAGITPTGAESIETIAGMTEAQQQAVLDNLAKKNEGLHDQIAKTLKKDTVVVKNLLNSHLDAMGVKEDGAKQKFFEDTAKDLGLGSAADLMKLTQDEFIKKMEDSIAKDTKQVRDLNQTIASPAASPAERTAARAELVRLGAHGTRTLAEETAELGKTINELNDISVNGKTFTSIGALLKDKELEGVMLRALDTDDPEDSAAAVKTLTDLGLMNDAGTGLFDKYSKALKLQLEADRGKLTSVISEQKNAQKILTLDEESGLKLSPQIAKSVFGSTGLAHIPPSLSKFVDTVKGLKLSEKQDIVNALKGLSEQGHSDLLMDVAAAPDAETMRKMIPNLNYILNAEKAEGTLGRLGDDVSYKDLSSLVSLGLVTQDELDFSQMIGIGAKDMLASVKNNAKTVESWRGQDPSIRPFGLEVDAFKPQPIKAGPVQIQNAIMSTGIDNLDQLDTLANRAEVPDDLKKVAKTRKTELKKEYTGEKIRGLADKYPLPIIPGLFQIDGGVTDSGAYENSVMAYNSNIDSMIRDLQMYPAGEDGSKIDNDSVLRRIEELTKMKISSTVVEEMKQKIKEQKDAEATAKRFEPDTSPDSEADKAYADQQAALGMLFNPANQLGALKAGAKMIPEGPGKTSPADVLSKTTGIRKKRFKI